MSNLIQNIENLTAEELKAVANLIDKFTKRKTQPHNKPKNKNKLPKRRYVRNTDSELIADQSYGRKNSRKRIVNNDTEEHVKSTKGRGRTEPSKEYNQQREIRRRGQNSKGGRAGKTMARTESVQLSGENRFLTMKERNLHRADSQVDKMLWGTNEVSPRSDVPYEASEVQCKICKLWYDVHPSMILMDEDTNEINFTCDNCIRK